MIGFLRILTFIYILFSISTPAYTEEFPDDADAYRRGQELAKSGVYFSAASYFFNVYAGESPYRMAALVQVTEQLMSSRMPHAAVYFFIKTLQSDNRAAIRRVLKLLPDMLQAVGGDLLRPYLLRHSTATDYEPKMLSYFQYFLAKDELLKGNPEQAFKLASSVSDKTIIFPQAQYLRGVSAAMLLNTNVAIESFTLCGRLASDISKVSPEALKQEARDLQWRCKASLARTLYQQEKFTEAEEVYDEIPKTAFVWTDILFEQAWTAFSKKDYNRALGKLVTYRSPSLQFIFNPEVEVLRAQSFLALCHFDEASKTIDEFSAKYAQVGSQMKQFLLQNDANLPAFYNIAKVVYQKPLHNSNFFSRVLNRFVRSPYFASHLYYEGAANTELRRVQSLARSRPNLANFGAFIEKVLTWRIGSTQLLGGLFVKNSLLDQYQDLIAQLDHIAFIKLEMLKQNKISIAYKPLMTLDTEGNLKRGAERVERKDYQYYWTFNGEFWFDELGDYVFALESRCGA